MLITRLKKTRIAIRLIVFGSLEVRKRPALNVVTASYFCDGSTLTDAKGFVND